MNLRLQQIQHQTRRQFLRNVGQFSLGAIAMESMLARTLSGAPGPGPAPNPLAPRAPHFAAMVKRVIYLHMSGVSPPFDLSDYKSELVKRDGQFAPDAFVKGKTFAFTSGTRRLMGTRRSVSQHGKGGI